MKNKIVILPDSVVLYSNFIGDDKFEHVHSFPKGGLTYLIKNNNIKFYAFEDYLYRNIIVSFDLPLYIVDEEMGIDGEYDLDDNINEILDRIYPTDENDSNYITRQEAEDTYQPIGDYLTESSLTGYATEAWVQNQGYLTEHQSLDDYLTKDEASQTYQPIGNYLVPSSLTGYATEQWVQNQGYLTQHQSLEDYYTKTEADNRYQPIGDYLTQSDLNGYATEQWVQNQGYLTQHQDISGKADNSALTAVENALTAHTADTTIHVTSTDKTNWDGKQDELVSGVNIKTINNQSLLGSGNITIQGGGDLSNYYTKTEVDNNFQPKGNYLVPSSLTGYATEQWVQNQGYLTQHQSLDGYATQQWVQSQGYLTQHQSLENYYPKSVVNALISDLQLQIDALTDALAACCTGQTGQTQARVATTIYSTAANANMDVGSFGEIERITIESGGTYYPSSTGDDVFPMPKAGSNRANIYLVNGVTTLGNTAKWQGDAISYNFSAATGVTRIGQNCFKDSSHLQTLTLPSSVTTIADHAFDNCPALETLRILAVTPPTLEYFEEEYDAIKTLMDNNQNVTVYVPSTALAAYQSATGWSAYSNRISAIS